MLILGYKIRKLRNLKKLTQDKLGELIGVSKEEISQYENGKRTPPNDKIISLANALNVSYNYLMDIEYFVVAEDDQNTSLNISKIDIEIIKELKLHPELYIKIIDDLHRSIDRIDRLLRDK